MAALRHPIDLPPDRDAVDDGVLVPPDRAGPSGSVHPVVRAWDLGREWRGRYLDSPARIVGAVGALVVVVGLGWWLLRPAAPPIEATVPRAPTALSGSSDAGSSSAGPSPTSAGPASSMGAPADAASASTTTVPTELVVAAAGAVGRPGVYHLPAGSRVDDLIREAGGLAAGADADRVNLAAPLADGERVWVPRRGETTTPSVVAGDDPTGGAVGAAPSGAKGAGAATPTGPVDLNTATAEQLDGLPGVGPATAQAILAYRQQHGRFGAVDDLLDVRGIGDAKLEQLRPLVTV